MSDNILSKYLTHTLVPALHERRIHIGDDTYLVRNEDVFVHISRIAPAAGDDHWFIVATPGWDGATTTIPIDVHHDAGAVVFADNAADVEWTGMLDYDVEVYLHTVRNHIVNVVLPALSPEPVDMKTKLKAIEGNLRSTSTDLWTLTVDDPETATVESEKAGMTPEREILHTLRLRLDSIAVQIESLINA